jgi:hypothetical protein
MQFWAELGNVISPEMIAQIGMDFLLRGDTRQALSFFANDQMVPARAERLLLPLIRRQYLDHAALMETTVRMLNTHPPMRAKILERLIEFDGQNDARSALLWNGLTLQDAAHPQAAALRVLALNAKVPQNAAQAFFHFIGTAAGQAEVEQDGGKAWLESFLEAAFKKNEATRSEFLLALVTTKAEGIAPARRLADFLIAGSIVLKLPPEKKKWLEQAWQSSPEALKRIEAKQ